MGYIYKITNLINNKLYIGQTQVSLEKRWKEHILDSKRYDYKFSRALRKYGEENFKMEVIEEIPDNMLNDREIYWISFYDSYKHGYNSTLGGSGALKTDRDLIKKLWDDGYSVKEISEKVELSPGRISIILQGYKNYSHQESITRSQRDRMIGVCQYDLNGNFIQEFKSMADAAREVGCRTSNISKCCNTDNTSCCGYLWRLVDQEPPEPYVDKSIRSVSQYDMDGNFINKFDSILEASVDTDTNSTSIIDCCKKRRKTANNYQWIYTGDAPPNKIDKYNYNRREVLQFDKNDVFITKFSSIREASISVGVSECCISSCLAGRQKSSGGYVWKYLNE